MYVKTLAAALTGVLLAGTSEAYAVDGPENFGLDPIVTRAPAQEISVFVSDITEGNAGGNFSFNKSGMLIPASVQKVITSLGALSLLGPEYTFSTKLYSRQGREAGRGNLSSITIVGGGDPTLTTEKVYAAGRVLKQRGITKVDQLFIVDSHFKGSKPVEGNRAYYASASGAAINFNARQSAVCQPNKHDISRCTTSYQALTLPAEEYLETWKTELNHAGIAVGQSSILSAEKVLSEIKNQKLLYEINSEPLTKLIFDLNHFSTNILADSMVFHLGCSNGENEKLYYCSFEKGLSRLSGWLKSSGVTNATIADGSGLSRRNRVTTEGLATILSHGYKDSLIGPEFISSLSVSGRSGTLKSRRFHPEILFRGKTGSLDGVITLAGFVRTAKGKDKVVVLLLNGVTDVQKAKTWEESFVKAVYDRM